MSFTTKLATFVGCVVSSLVFCGAKDAAAQDAYLARIYGDGVHQYFRHDSSTAKCRFNTVIDEGSRDPRAYYFRAIIALEAGDTTTADSDIRIGAKYELEGRGTYDVWSGLARVQGPHRVKFECMRNSALLALRKQSVTDRYPLNYSNDPEKLRRPVDPYRTDLEPNVNSIYGDDPFMNEDQPPQAPLEIEDEDDEPMDDMEPEENDALGDDDFGDTMDEPEVSDEDPFGDDLGGDDDPFAGDTMEEAPVEEIPAGETADDSDPFGDDGGDNPFGADDATEIIEDAPLDDGSDPFGGEADDDPFGDIFE
jgi:hypothetical protein